MVQLFNLHDYNNPSKTFISTVTGSVYPIKQALNCDSHNIIYLVTCKSCHIQYVGETGRRHKDRCKEHVQDIKKNKDCPISSHFHGLNHALDHFSIQVIEKCRNEDTAFRRLRENYWRKVLKCEVNRGFWKRGASPNFATNFAIFGTNFAIQTLRL